MQVLLRMTAFQHQLGTSAEASSACDVSYVTKGPKKTRAEIKDFEAICFF